MSKEKTRRENTVKKLSKLHEEYLRYFTPNNIKDNENHSFAQPNPYKYIPTSASDAVIEEIQKGE